MQNDSKKLFGEARSLIASAPPSVAHFQKIVGLVSSTRVSCARELVPYLRGVFASWPEHFCHLSVSPDPPLKLTYSLARHLTVQASRREHVDIIKFVCNTPHFQNVKSLRLRDPIDVYKVSALASHPFGQALEGLDVALYAGAEAWPYAPLKGYPAEARFPELQSLTLRDCVWTASALNGVLNLTSSKLHSLSLCDFDDIMLVENLLYREDFARIKSLSLEYMWGSWNVPFGLCGSLEYLALSECKCCALDFVGADFTNLQTLDLRKASIASGDLARLRAIHPHVEILSSIG